MLTVRSIILVFVLFCWKTSKKFLLTFERQKSRTSKVFFLNIKPQDTSKPQVIRGTQYLTHVQLLIQKLEVLLKSLFMNISRSAMNVFTKAGVP